MIGEAFALAAAVAWAFAVILFKKSGETHSPFTLNFFRVGISCLLFGATLLALREPLIRDVPLFDYLILAASGIIAIAISDTFFHKSLNITGASINAIVDCLYSPFVVLFAFLLLSERLTLQQYAGMFLVISGVLLATRTPSPSGIPVGQLVIGVLWGAAAMATLAFGIVIAKPVLERSPVLWATTMRQFASLAVMLPVALHPKRRARVALAFKPGRGWRYSLTGTIFGSYVALLCWIASMKYTAAGTAAILNQSSTIFILILATIFLREPFTRRKFFASLLAIAGILLVILGSPATG